eukprot:9703118-Lingulodinium_polyedra.AAC.1
MGDDSVGDAVLSPVANGTDYGLGDAVAIAPVMPICVEAQRHRAKIGPFPILNVGVARFVAK